MSITTHHSRFSIRLLLNTLPEPIAREIGGISDRGGGSVEV